MVQGGKRKGAGRPAGTGKFKVPTKVMRIPADMESDVIDFLTGIKQGVRFFSSTVQAGYATAVEQETEVENINLHSYLVEDDKDTFIVTASGQSMINAGIYDGDLMVVNSRTRARDGDIVVAEINGEFTVKRLYHQKGMPILQPENPDFKPIKVKFNDELKILGVVTYCVHKV